MPALSWLPESAASCRYLHGLKKPANPADSYCFAHWLRRCATCFTPTRSAHLIRPPLHTEPAHQYVSGVAQRATAQPTDTHSRSAEPCVGMCSVPPVSQHMSPSPHIPALRHLRMERQAAWQSTVCQYSANSVCLELHTDSIQSCIKRILSTRCPPCSSCWQPAGNHLYGGKPMASTVATSKSAGLSTMPSAMTRQPSLTTGKKMNSIIS